jgi:plastocyanin
MHRIWQPGGSARRVLLRHAVAAGVLVVIARPAAQAAGAPEIIIDNFTFAPTPLNVKVGTTVTWLNHDDIPHSIVCPDLKLKSHPLDTDDSFACKFDQVGTYDYICGLHPHMHGQVVVEA